MPGKKGIKLIPRKATSGKYHSVRELVFALFDKTKGMITKDECEKLVRKEYPKSNFFSKDGRGGHFTWYKHKWNRMKLEEESFNLKDVHAHIKDEEEEKTDEQDRDESKKDKVGRAKKVEPKTVGKGSDRPKGRRVQIHKDKRKVGVKTGETVLQRDGDPEDNRLDAEAEELLD